MIVIVIFPARQEAPFFLVRAEQSKHYSNKIILPKPFSIRPNKTKEWLRFSIWLINGHHSMKVHPNLQFS